MTKAEAEEQVRHWIRTPGAPIPGEAFSTLSMDEVNAIAVSERPVKREQSTDPNDYDMDGWVLSDQPPLSC